ncbi:hypothetical protein DU49_05665 [Methanosarcina mazei]|uniref:Uncharacterized protein n=1 Tax=Methanosarcina mazei TaxID=2209 RepID=A0A0F8FRG9_METMZ|nr:hypothetical protein DU49_05665 [Methanosarcina mazei]
MIHIFSYIRLLSFSGCMALCRESGLTLLDFCFEKDAVMYKDQKIRYKPKTVIFLLKNIYSKNYLSFFISGAF